MELIRSRIARSRGRFIPAHLVHDLQEFHDGGVPGFPDFVQGLVNLAYGAGPALPQNPQDGQFRLSRSREFTHAETIVIRTGS